MKYYKLITTGSNEYLGGANFHAKPNNGDHIIYDRIVYVVQFIIFDADSGDAIINVNFK